MKARIIIGRNPKADLVVPAEFAKVSGSHIIIEHRNDSYQMMDPGSRNGTQLNGTMINQNQFYQINPNDQIVLGKQYPLKWNDVLQAFHTVTPQPVSHQQEASEAAPQEKEYSYDYAGFWVRFAAYFFDAFILLIGLVIIESIFGLNIFAMIQSGNRLMARYLFSNFGVFWIIKTIILYVVLPYLYFAFMESSAHQATLGKKLMGLIVTDDNLQPITFGRATGRFFAKILSSIPFDYGFIMVGSHPEKKAFHDVLAGTRIIRIKKNLRFPG